MNYCKMTKEERRRVMLRFLAERDVALPPKVLYNNLMLYKTITFGAETVQRHLIESAEMGLAEKIEFGHSYYRVTDIGRRYAHGEITLDELMETGKTEDKS